MSGKRALTLVLGAALAVVLAAAPAAATFLSPVADRHEPGDEATLVGYVMPPPPGWEEAGPYTAFLRTVGPLSTQVQIGPLDVDDVTTPAGPALRVSLVFRVPPDAPAGVYEVTYCDAACTGGLGDLVGSHPLYVGVEPAAPIVREWARNEPEIANLAADAVVAGPGFRATAAELRAPVAPPTTPTTASTAPPPTPPAPVATVPLGPPLDLPAPPPPPEPAANGWYVALGMGFALALTAGVLAAMRLRA